MISLTITAVFAVVYLLATLGLCRGVKLDARALCLGGVVCALTLVLASIRVPLPTGSNITCGSWIPLMLLALVYDYRLSILAGWVCGLLAMILIPGWQAVHWYAFPAWATPASSALRNGKRLFAAWFSPCFSAAAGMCSAVSSSILRTPGTDGVPGGTALPTTSPPGCRRGF